MTANRLSPVYPERSVRRAPPQACTFPAFRSKLHRNCGAEMTTWSGSDLQTCRRSHFGTHPPIHYPLSSHALTWNPFCNPFVFKFMHGMGGVYPLDVRTFTRFDAFPTYPLSFHILAHSFALGQSSTLLFSIDSALFAENTRGWGTPAPRLPEVPGGPHRGSFRHFVSFCYRMSNLSAVI